MKIRISFFLACIATFLFACGTGGSDDTPVTASPFTIKFTVANLPEILPVNRASTANGVDEYAWVAIFDMDKSGTINPGDIQIGLIYNNGDFAFPQNLPNQLYIDQFIVAIITFTEGGHSGQFYFGSKDVKISGNTINLHIDIAELNRIGIFNSEVPIYFKTTGVDDSGNTFHDYYPAQDTFTSIPADGKFIDEIAEVETGGQQHIDLVSIEVLIN